MMCYDYPAVFKATKICTTSTQMLIKCKSIVPIILLHFALSTFVNAGQSILLWWY